MSYKKLNNLYAFKLKQLRKKYKLTQSILSEHLGLKGQQQYSDLETGDKQFSDEIILKICDLFHISVLDFTNIHESEKKANLFLSSEEKKTIEQTSDPEIKILIYKKLFLETKIENIEMKLSLLQSKSDKLHIVPSKYRVHVII